MVLGGGFVIDGKQFGVQQCHNSTEAEEVSPNQPSPILRMVEMFLCFFVSMWLVRESKHEVLVLEYVAFSS